MVFPLVCCYLGIAFSFAVMWWLELRKTKSLEVQLRDLKYDYDWLLHPVQSARKGWK